MANPYRGEYKYALGEQVFILKLSFTKLVHLEESLEIGIFDLAKRFVDGCYGFKEIVETLYAGLENDYPIGKEEFGNLIVKHGIAEQAIHCINLLSMALSGKKSDPKEEK